MWSHKFAPCCNLDAQARQHSRDRAIAVLETQTAGDTPQTERNMTLRERIRVAEATRNVDRVGRVEIRQTQDGTVVESLWLNGVDLFKWFGTACLHDLTVHVRLEVVDE
jgi:hypothetical protein